MLIVPGLGIGLGRTPMGVKTQYQFSLKQKFRRATHMITSGTHFGFLVGTGGHALRK